MCGFVRLHNSLVVDRPKDYGGEKSAFLIWQESIFFRRQNNTEKIFPSVVKKKKKERRIKIIIPSLFALQEVKV